ncbi:MAG: BglG family transcription antiterminator LicT [Lachnospiraceae bacterium]
MQILKVINNNVVSAYNEKGKEVIVTGKGIGFQKKPKDEIDDTKVEKVFRLDDEMTGEFERVVADIPYDHIQIVARIITMANDLMDHELSKGIYISLLDHLNYAIIRGKEGIQIENSLLWEIKRFYSAEYQIGLYAIDLIKRELGISLPEDEAGFVAMHILNAELGSDMKKTSIVPDVLKDVYNIIGYSAKHKIDESSIYYDRFVIHLKFLVERIVKKIEYTGQDDALYDMIREQFPESYRCALRIQTYLKSRMDYVVPDEELAYLTIHIESLMKNS